jgi:hypothetical protein
MREVAGPEGPDCGPLDEGSVSVSMFHFQKPLYKAFLNSQGFGAPPEE